MIRWASVEQERAISSNARLLRAHRQRPRDGRAAEQRVMNLTD